MEDGVHVRNMGAPVATVKYPILLHPEIGRFEAEFFDPAKWKPEYPNPAFDRMLPDDAFWAAKIVARFSDDAIRAIAKTGDYLSPDAERYLADTLIKRRDKVVEHYFGLVSPLEIAERLEADLCESAQGWRHRGKLREERAVREQRFHRRVVRRPRLQPRAHGIAVFHRREPPRDDALGTNRIDDTVEGGAGPVTSDARPGVEPDRLDDVGEHGERLDRMIAREARQHPATAGLVLETDSIQVETQIVQALVEVFGGPP